MPPRGERLVASLLGRRFGQLEVIEDLGAVHGAQRIYLCRCDCGALVQRRCYRLRHPKGSRQSCAECHRQSTRRLSVEHQVLAETYFEWAIHVAWRWKFHWRRFEDEIDSAVSVGLVTAARDYDPSRGRLGFEPWCYQRMSKEVARTIRRLKRHEEFQASLIAMVERFV